MNRKAAADMKAKTAKERSDNKGWGEIWNEVKKWYRRYKENSRWHRITEFRLAFASEARAAKALEQADISKWEKAIYGDQRENRRRESSFEHDRQHALRAARDKYIEKVKEEAFGQIDTLAAAEQALEKWDEHIQGTPELQKAREAIAEWQENEKWQKAIKAGEITYDESDDDGTINQNVRFSKYNRWKEALRAANKQYIDEAGKDVQAEIDKYLFDHLEYAQQAIEAWKLKIRNTDEWSEANKLVEYWAAVEAWKSVENDENASREEKEQARKEHEGAKAWYVALNFFEEKVKKVKAEHQHVGPLASLLHHVRMKIRPPREVKALKAWKQLITWEKAKRDSKTQYENEYLLKQQDGGYARRGADADADRWERVEGFANVGPFNWLIDKKDGVSFGAYRRCKFLNEWYRRRINPFIDVLIILNFIVVVGVFFVNSDLMHQHFTALSIFCSGSVVVFTLEIILRLTLAYYEAKIQERPINKENPDFKDQLLNSRVGKFGSRLWYFFGKHKTKGWNTFDFLVTLVSAVALVLSQIDFSGFRSMRLLRLANIFRAFDNYKKIRQMYTRILASLKGIFLLLLGFMLLYTFYAIIGISLFKTTDPEYFGSMGRALYTLFQMMTLAEWNDISDKVMIHHKWAWTYFVSFIIIAVYLLLNIMVGIIVDALSRARQKENKGE